MGLSAAFGALHIFSAHPEGSLAIISTIPRRGWTALEEWTTNAELEVSATTTRHASTAIECMVSVVAGLGAENEQAPAANATLIQFDGAPREAAFSGVRRS